MQEIFADIWKSAKRYNPDLGSEATFISVITRRRVIDAIRKLGRHTTVVPFDGVIEYSASTNDSESGSDHSSALHVLKSLPPQRRRVLELSIFRGLSHSQIVAATQLPLGTVKAHIRRGLDEVRKRMHNEAPTNTTGEVCND